MATSSPAKLYFDPDLHPDDTLKTFVEFIKMYELRYDASYPDPPKVAMEQALERWKIIHPEQTPSIKDYDELRDEWRSHDKVAKLLGLFSSMRLYSDWELAEPDEKTRKQAGWDVFITKMKAFYQPTENTTLKHYQFRSLSQEQNETFNAFAIRVEKEAKHCNFKCTSANCTAESVAIRDQIVIGLSNDEIRQEALKHSWDLKDLRKNATRIESAFKGASEISGDSNVNKMGKYSYSKIKNQKQSQKPKSFTCYFCGQTVSSMPIQKHVEQCHARSAKCAKYGKMGHFSKVCKSSKKVNEVSKEDVEDDKEETDQLYNVNLFRVTENNIRKTDDFKVHAVINTSMDKILADTGAKISVCGVKDAKKWNIYGRMVPTQVKIKPYKSYPIPVKGTARCAVTFGHRSTPVQWHIIDQHDCEPILAGKAAEQLGIIKFSSTPDVFQPVNMIHADEKQQIQQILQQHPNLFKGIGKLKNHLVKLHVDTSIKPIAEPDRTIPYHLQDRVNEILQEMIDNDIIEEHPVGEPAPWTSNMVIAPKPDGDFRVTLDARNINKGIQSCNAPIPKHEDIKARLGNAKVFSKMDLKSAFWQLELHPDSRYLTVFHAKNRLYRQKRVSMGLKPAQGELNAALYPLFAHIKGVHLIHDDLVIAALNMKDHNEALKEVMQVIEEANLTLNPKKCVFGVDEIDFWGLKIGADGVKPNPDKVDALKYITRPNNKAELLRFLCMMQSNADFIPNFAKKAALLRELTKKNRRFNWQKNHQQCFEDLVQSFSKETLLRFFDLNKATFLFVDAHKTGLGAILSQGTSINDAKPVAIASRTTEKAEKRYPQIDLEGMAVDFGLRRFRNYLVGSPKEITVVTDHKPLCNIFNGKRKGSIRTDKVKMQNQDVRFSVCYQKGSANQTDYISRHAKPLWTQS